ncbi:ABC transporter substrate-binding protein [Paenibacillus sp. UNC451MF]|uniref:ABC transporter substrate-binding protein n=1 Tax=Paenibacillus sp. UNC451MF TaxID=1449063 RepID=UPI00048F7076|nr:extracellular solute-binding protein [Paenibacillus sp. UNC451MF]
MLKRKKNIPLLVTMSVLGTFILAGCGKEAATGEGKAVNPDAYNNEPVTLTIYSYNASVLNDTDLEELVTRSIKAKFPNITPQLIPQSATTLDKMIASGEIPDMILSTSYWYYDLLDRGLVSDLNSFIKNENISFSKFEPEAIDVMKSFSDKGEILGMPYSIMYNMLIYNKDIFDKFAVPYPKDGMTWDETIELAKRVTRVEQGVQYVGLDIGPPTRLTRQLGLPAIDEKGEKAVFQTEGYKKAYSLLEKLYGIPGIVEPNKRYEYGIDFFLKDQKLAMYQFNTAAITARLPQLKETGKDFNWDVVSLPTFEDKKGYSREPEVQMAAVTPNSKNKKAAYAVIKTMISEEAQRAMNRGSKATVLADPAMKKEYALDTKLYEGKNIKNVFVPKLTKVPRQHKYDIKVYPFLNEAAKKIAYEKKDINTVLREAEEKANKWIQENK